MEKSMIFIIKCKGLDWSRRIKIDENEVFYFFKDRLASFDCIIETKNSLVDCVDCSIETSGDTYNLIDDCGQMYNGLSLSSCYSLVCMKYINIKKERVDIHAWVLHSGSFIFNNDLFLIVGSTYSGKSTTMFELLKQQYDIKYINDDVTLFDTNSLEIIPFCKPIQLRNVINENKIDDCWVDAFDGKNFRISTISPPNMGFSQRIKYNGIKMFLLIHDNNKRTSITHVNNLQKFLSLMLNCYNDSVAENRKNILKIKDDITGYQIVFNDGDNVAKMIISNSTF